MTSEQQLTGLEGEILRRKLRKDYASYVEFVNEGFFMTKFHKYICNQVQEFLEYKDPNHRALDILLLSVPPRHGKSYMVTETLPAWYLGNNRNGEVILSSYQTTIAESFSRPARDKVTQFGKSVFGIGPNPTIQTKEYWETEAGGKCRAAGLDAGITRYGANLFIIDDPIKNAKEASSEVIIKGILNEMGPSVQSRIYPGGKLIVIQTRWVENDVVGFIKDNWAEFIWKDINLPCEYDDDSIPCPLGRQLGDSLMGPHLGDIGLPEKIANDNMWLKSKKSIVIAAEGQRTWDSLYQGRPTGATGNTFDPEWWQGGVTRSEFVFEKEREHMSQKDLIGKKTVEYLQLSVDATFKGGENNDFVAMGLRGIYKGKIILFHQVNKRMGFVSTVEKIQSLYEQFPEIDELVIEDKANGSAIADVLKNDPKCPPIVCVNPMGGKVSRAEAIAPSVKSGLMVIVDDLDDTEVDWHTPTTMTGREKIIYQHKLFPFGKHDDMVDEGSQGNIRLIKLITGEEPTPERRFLRYTRWYPDMWEDFEQMTAKEQEEFVQKYGAPEEWMDHNIGGFSG